MKLPPSLRARLFAFLLALASVTALAVGGATYVSVRAEADELFDYHLRQMALSLRDQGRIAPDERSAFNNPEFDYVVQIWSVDGAEVYASGPRAAPPLPPRAVLGFSQLQIGSEDWRLYAAATPLRVVQVAQPLSVRRRLAAAAALHSVVPVLVAAPLVALGLWWLIGISLAPLQGVVLEAQARGAGSLEALPLAGLPSEVQPLVGAFNGLLVRVASAFEAQRSFVADAAHELRTPLTALTLQIGLLQGARPGPEVDAAVQQLKAGVARATHLVQQLLLLARAEPGAAAPLVEIDLAVVARQAMVDAKPLAEQAGVQVELDAPAPLPLRGDPEAWRSALRNLLDNAIKFGAHSVRLSALREGDTWRVQVDDDGPGIPSADRARVFDRFQRAQASHAEGSGLGLAIVQAVARRHDATVQLSDAPLGGLRVDIWGGAERLPVRS